MQVSPQESAGPSEQSFCEDSTVQQKLQRSALQRRAWLCHLGTASTPERQTVGQGPECCLMLAAPVHFAFILPKPFTAPGPIPALAEGQLQPQSSLQVSEPLIPRLSAELSSAGALCASRTFFLEGNKVQNDSNYLKQRCKVLCRY